MSAPLKRAWKRGQKDKEDGRFGRMDPDRPPPLGASGGPVGGAWREGRPENESLRQGEFKSPYTGQVYDRWAPIGLKQKGTDRQGGLGRARAYETPMQRKIRIALDPENEKKVAEIDKYYPGTAPPHLVPAKEPKKVKQRYGKIAGSFKDFIKQFTVQTVIDLKAAKSEKPIWYVEACAGEGEYHISRMKTPDDDPMDELKVLWPKAEDVYGVLRDEDLTYHPPEIQGWMRAMRLLNCSEDAKAFEEQGDKISQVEGEVKWLPSTTLCALQMLRKQDVVTLFENNPISFASLHNFVRNWSHKFEAKLEMIFKRSGLREIFNRFGPKYNYGTEAHGNIDGRRGVILADPDKLQPAGATMLINGLFKHWRSATVIVTYTLSEVTEERRQKWLKELRQANPGLDLMTAELHVDVPEWAQEFCTSNWSAQGVLISNPPGSMY